MLASERRQRLLELVRTQGFVRTAELGRRFEVSTMTIRRDLEELEHRGLLNRVRGGATSATARDLGYGRRERLARRDKEAVGRAAAALVRSDETVFVDAGTSAMEAARHLVKRQLSSLHLVTTSVKVSAELAGLQGVHVIQLGGELYRRSYGVVGDEVVRTLARMRFTWALLGASGVDADSGISDNNPAEVAVKRAALRRARRSVFLADASKLGKVGAVPVAPIEEAHTLITTAPRHEVRRFETHGWEVIVAEAG